MVKCETNEYVPTKCALNPIKEYRWSSHNGFWVKRWDVVCDESLDHKAKKMDQKETNQ